MIQLSRRERQVLEDASNGFTVRETAMILNVAPSTVKYYRGRLVKKLEADSITHAVAIALRKGLIK